MDVQLIIDDQRFAWDSNKAALNVLRHGVSFDLACRVFADPFAIYEDASPSEETWQACIGETPREQLLYVVHAIREGDVLRIISARPASRTERKRYEDSE